MRQSHWTLFLIPRRKRQAHWPVCIPLTIILPWLLLGCSATRIEQRSFLSPEEATGALVNAARNNDVPTLLAIFGAGGHDILSSGDETADNQRRQKFIDLYEQKHSIVHDATDSATLVIGDTDWPFPIPLVHGKSGWIFDTPAGKEEILNRRIGTNELAAIQVCKAIGDAQREFALQTFTPRGMHEYAQQFFSDPGKHNGLYWHTTEGEPASPLGDLAAQAAAEGYTRRKEGPTPYHGYYYRILRAQGPNAPEGTLSYIVNSRMVLGFAIVAYPADYGNSGIMTFIMNQDGIVFQKDLGNKTARIASTMRIFDPDASWKKAEQ